MGRLIEQVSKGQGMTRQGDKGQMMMALFNATFLNGLKASLHAFLLEPQSTNFERPTQHILPGARALCMGNVVEMVGSEATHCTISLVQAFQIS